MQSLKLLATIWAFEIGASSPPLSLSVCDPYGVFVRKFLASIVIRAALGAREQRGQSEKRLREEGGLQALSALKRLDFGSNFGKC